VAATFQAFINDPETVLALMANEELERSLEDLREMESVLINVDRDKEEMVPRPEPDEAGREEVEGILDEAEDLFAEYRGRLPDSVADALLDVAPARDVEAEPDADHETLASTAREAATLDAEAVSAVGVESDALDPDRLVGADSDGADPAGADSAGEASPGSPPASDVDGDRSPESTTSPRAPTAPDHDAFEGVADATPPSENGRDDEAVDGIDFDEPFEEGIDVLGQSPGDGTEEQGDEPDADEADDQGGNADGEGETGTDDEPDRDWGFGTVDPPEED